MSFLGLVEVGVGDGVVDGVGDGVRSGAMLATPLILCRTSSES